MTRTVRLAALLLQLLSAPLFAQEGTAVPKREDRMLSMPADLSLSPAEAVTTSHAIATFDAPDLPADFPHLRYVNPEAPKGGEISIAYAGGYDSFNPFTVKGRGEVLSSFSLERLMISTADEIGVLYCLLCESVEYPESRDWAVFTLREGVAFADGTPLTADDVLFSYETLRDKGLSSFRAVIAQSVAGGEVIDDRRIRFKFVPGYPRREVVQTVASLPVFSRWDFQENGFDLGESQSKPFLASGPYVLESADMGRNAIWKRNPDYWGKDLPVNLGRHNFDRIRVEYFGDGDAAFEGFKAGEYTFRRENSSLIWATGYDFPGVQSGHVIKESVTDGDKAPAQGFFFNLRREKFQDPRVREAIGLMFNFEWSNQTLFYGLYERTQSFWDNSELKAEGKPSEGELALLTPLADQLPEGVLTEDAVLPSVSGERQLDRGNLRRALALLDEAGWSAGSDGMLRNAEGQVLAVEFLNNSDMMERVINPFVENLCKLGIEAKITRVDETEYETRRYRFDYDIIMGHALTYMVAGDGLYQTFGSKGADDVFNPAGISNPTIDKLIDAAVAARTEEEMVTATHALDRALRAMRPWVPNWYNAEMNIAYYDQYEYPDELPPYLTSDPSFQWYLDFWWYNAEKAEQLKKAGVLR
ncbi:MAG: extracellular solute-binding protein [Paracoccus sp. (in: a-proteobacteria)]